MGKQDKPIRGNGQGNVAPCGNVLSSKEKANQMLRALKTIGKNQRKKEKSIAFSDHSYYNTMAIALDSIFMRGRTRNRPSQPQHRTSIYRRCVL